MKTKALVIFYPDCIEFEAILAAQVLHGENLTIDIATPDGSDYLGPSGIALRATHSYADVHPEEYRVVIVPGGDTKSVLENETLVGILKAANDAGATFGAICAGPLAPCQGWPPERTALHAWLWTGFPITLLERRHVMRISRSSWMVTSSLPNPRRTLISRLKSCMPLDCARVGLSNPCANQEDSRRTGNLKLRRSRPTIGPFGAAHSTRGMPFVSAACLTRGHT